LSNRNTLNFQNERFPLTSKNRLVDPSEIRALDFKHQFRRSAICAVSTIGVDWSNLEIFREDGIITLAQKRPSAMANRALVPSLALAAITRRLGPGRSSPS
jgi:hypothetical protein